jgi:hypothetical protein
VIIMIDLRACLRQLIRGYFSDRFVDMAITLEVVRDVHVEVLDNGPQIHQC